MPFLIPIAAGIGGSLVSKLIGGGGGGSKSKTPASPAIDPQLQQLIDLQKGFAQYGFPAAQSNFGKAGAAYDTSLDFYKKILTGSDEDIMSLFNAKEYTKSADESNDLAYNLQGRSGARAATLSQTSFDRQGFLQGILEQLRLGAPDHIANIGQAIANMGAAQAGASTGTAQGASNILFSQQQLQQQAADRRTNLISSIIGSAGSILGGYLGSKGGDN